MFKMTKTDSLPMRPRVTPDPERAAETSNERRYRNADAGRAAARLA